MLFNSYPFLLGFLPVTLIGFFTLARRSRLLAAGWLAFASLAFYGWWNPRYVPLLVGSIAFNFLIGGKIARAAQPRRKLLLAFAIAIDLLLLGYYKYANFLLETVNVVSGTHLFLETIVLPLGISFFTFPQIAFLVDTYFEEVKEYRFVHYLLFVTYFPHLIAGPILHHKEMMPQFERSDAYRPTSENFAVGATIFFIGLFKKTVIADSLAPYAGHLFSTPGSPQFFEAWGGALAYTFQLYFDFSGYSDMAIGLSRMFGICLPLNFNSPYKAVNISDFWRRWHMTLSRFLRDYLYIPLGGNRKGGVRRNLNLLTTMLLGGLWHGAGWTFLIWGGLHGLYLAINHAWQGVRARLGHDPSATTRRGRISARTLTFIAVVVGWVFFRAVSMQDALAILRGMAGLNGVSLPAAFAPALGPVGSVLESLGLTFSLGGGSRFMTQYAWLIVLAPVVFVLPNTQELMGRFRPALDFRTSATAQGLSWSPTRRWSLVIGLLAAAGLLSLSRVSEFLYYQF